jgi:fermentation-respiration switch protein FrsA (DUF1100 family)
MAGARIRCKAVLLTVGGVVLLPLVSALSWLKWHEADLVFQNERSYGLNAFNGLTSPYMSGVEFAVASGERLQGLVLKPDVASDSGFWILHLHGNADSAFSAGQIGHAKKLRELGFNVLAFDYRGFGKSPGQPTETNVYEDSQAAFQWLIDAGVPPAKIIVWGHSLGSGPAVELATRHQVAGLVLFGAFTSVDDVAAATYPWLPVRWVVGIHFDNLQRMRNVHVPVVIAHAVTDLTIPISHAGRLYAAANEPKAMLTLQAISDDGFGGHVSALYEQLHKLMPLMRQLRIVDK